MKTYQLGLYEKAMPDLPWRKKLLTAKNAGYDFVELSIDAGEEKISRVYSSVSERRELLKLCGECGIPFGTLNASALTKYSLGNEDPVIRERGMDIALRCVELAADLAIRVVMIPGYDVYFGTSTPKSRELFLRSVQSLTEAAASAGVQLGFETMENEFMNTVEKAMRIVDAVGSNYLQIYPDIGNMTNAAVLYGTDAVEDLRLGKGHLVGLHLKETKPGLFREIPYGQGHVDFPAAVRAAWELGVRRYVTEFWYCKDGETPEMVCRHFRELFQALGVSREHPGTQKG